LFICLAPLLALQLLHDGTMPSLHVPPNCTGTM
jgi:hypothetical protein